MVVSFVFDYGYGFYLIVYKYYVFSLKRLLELYMYVCMWEKIDLFLVNWFLIDMYWYFIKFE